MTQSANAPASARNPTWSTIIPPGQWDIYLQGIRATRAAGAPFLIGGAFGLAVYTGRWRNTKDLDFFVLPSDKDKVIDALTKTGFEDYYDCLAYDRGWIYRGVKNDVIVDVIWQTPNRRTEVDQAWFERGRPVVLRDEQLIALPPEELLAIKLYVMQKDRCDWPDLLNLLYACCENLDWEHVLTRMQLETPLLTGLLHVFNWVAPEKAKCLPEWLRQKLHIPDACPEDINVETRYRVELLDSRPWFAAFQPENKPLQL